MFIHVMLRENRDDDIKDWYESQEDKSGVVREAIRAYIRLQNGAGQEAIIKEAVNQAMTRLPAIVAEAIRDTLAAYRFSPQERQAAGDEDPELAARLDAQLDGWDE